MNLPVHQSSRDGASFGNGSTKAVYWKCIPTVIHLGTELLGALTASSTGLVLARKTQGNVHEGVRKAPELHLVWVQHAAHLLDEPISDLDIYGHLPEAKVQVGNVLLHLVMKA